MSVGALVRDDDYALLLILVAGRRSCLAGEPQGQSTFVQLTPRVRQQAGASVVRNLKSQA